MGDLLSTAKDLWTDWKDLILAVVGGSGWIMYLVKRHHAAHAKIQQDASRALEEFLRPLEIRLEGNRRLQNILISDTDLRGLEYAPDTVQKYFQSLPPGDVRRLYWTGIVNEIFISNEAIIELIRGKAFHISNNDFREKCNEFIQHAIEWKSLWSSALSSGAPAKQGADLLTPRFPESMDSMLKVEIEHRLRQRG